MSNIGIIGYGTVGKATEHVFGGECDISWYDPNVSGGSPLEDVVEGSDYVFVCVPTPEGEKRNGIPKIDLSIMDESIGNIARVASYTEKIIIIKSTVVPKTTRGYSEKYPDCNFCFCPEFLTEAHYMDDAEHPYRIVVGADDNEVRERISELHSYRFMSTPLFRTDTVTAELSKYMANSLLAMKVAFANEIYDLCQKIGADYEKAKKIVLADGRIGKTHLNVTARRFFDGKCLPKDVGALINSFEDEGLEAAILKSVWEKNEKLKALSAVPELKD